MLKQNLMVVKMLHKFGKIKLEQNLKVEEIINQEQIFGKNEKKNLLLILIGIIKIGQKTKKLLELKVIVKKELVIQ